jgi:SAM-dependent methyltransferase
VRTLRRWRSRLAGWFERHRYDLVFYRRLEKAAILPWLHLGPGERVCELGCFNGANARAIAHRHGCTVVGLDTDKRVVRLAHAYNEAPGTRFLVASAEALPFRAGAFDRIFGISVLEHFTDGQVALREAARCLKGGGVLALTTDSFALGEVWHGTQRLHRDKFLVRRYYSQAELTRAVQAAGLRVIHAEPILRHWASGVLFEMTVRMPVVKSAAVVLLPLLRWIERVYGSRDAGYMVSVCAAKPSPRNAGATGHAGDEGA